MAETTLNIPRSGIIEAVDRTANYMAVRGQGSAAAAVENPDAVEELEWRRGINDGGDHAELERLLESSVAVMTPLLHGRHFRLKSVSTDAGSVIITYNPPKWEFSDSNLRDAIRAYLIDSVLTSWLEVVAPAEAVAYSQKLAADAAAIRRIVRKPLKPE